MMIPQTDILIMECLLQNGRMLHSKCRARIRLFSQHIHTIHMHAPAVGAQYRHVLCHTYCRGQTQPNRVHRSRTLSISPAVTTSRSLSVAPGIRARIELPRLPLYRHCPFRL